MNTYVKSLITILPVVLFIFFATVTTTYYFARSALVDLAETLLNIRLSEAMRITTEQQEMLRSYDLQDIAASITKAQIDAGTAISAIDVGKSGYIFAVNSQGIITMHPEEKRIGQFVGKTDWHRAIIRGGKGSLAITDRDTTHLAIYDYYPPWDWTILVAAPERQVYGAIYRMRPYLLYLGIASALLLAIALALLARHILAPLQLLTAGADSIGKGNLTTRIQVKTRDEFGRLANVFNQMASQLEKSHRQLEQKVAERTTALTMTNKQLKLEIEERKRAEHDSRVNEQKLQAILRASPIGIGLVVNRELNWANDTFYDIVGYTKEDLIGRSTKILYETTEEFDRVGYTLHTHSARQEAGQTETRLVRKDGTSISCAIRSYPINDTNPLAGLIFTVSDITEAKRLEEKLQRSQKMEAIGTLAGGVAHDLNNILSGIVSYPELLLLDMQDDNPLYNPLKTIQKSGEQAATVVQDLLTMARRGVAITEIINLNTIVSDQLKSPEYAKLASFHPNVHVSVRLADDLMFIKGSVVHLAKTIMNLLSNAAEAMPEGGEIRITTENIYIDQPIGNYEDVEEGDYVAVSVSDTGIGIPKTHMNRIFEPFYTKKAMGRSGTGLGMAVVWGTVKDHKGYIDIVSSENNGSTFKLYFPATRETVATAEQDVPLELYQGNGEQILVIDDSEVQREIARQMLKKLGYNVNTVSSGERAVEYLHDNPADLLVLDMIMPPNMDGLDTYRRIIEFKPAQKIIVASGFSETERVKEVLKLSKGQYIKKPYSIEKIGIAIKEELKK